MLMTIDEFITYFEEQSKEHTNLVPYDVDEEYNKNCKQLVDLLRELEAYRKAEKEIEQELVNWNDIDNGKCRGLFLATSIIQHYKDEEVTADE